ncbi:MAG: glycosyltransferase family 4 protein [Anaerolineales bacterium]|nr:glycosyltransferase family 4 protein [Anaerolineales bacterium]
MPEHVHRPVQTAASLPRIAMLHYSALPVVGGVEAVMAEHARLLAAAGYPVTVVVGRGGTEGLPAATRVVKIPEIDSEYPPNLELQDELDRGRPPAGFAALRDQIRGALEPALAGQDIVIIHNVMTMHFNLPLTAALHQLLDQGRLPRCVAWTHDASWEDPLQHQHVHPRYPWNLLRRLRPDVTYVVITRTRQATLAQMFHCRHDRLRVIPNGVHARFWWNLSPEGDGLIMDLGLLDGDLFLLQPVRITQLKNIAYSLRVAAALKNLGLAPRFAVTGPPDPHDPAGQALLTELRTLRRELDLESEAYFLTELGPDPDVPRVLPFTVVRDLYEACDLIWLPSTAEGFGIPVIEAGFLGRPVFCADIPVFREIGRNLVYRFKLDEEPLRVAARLAAWAERDRAYKLRRQVWRGYTWRAVMRDHLVPLIHELMARPAAPG